MGGKARHKILALSLALTGACYSPEQYSEQADAEVLPMLAETQDTTLGDREEWIQQPEPAKPVEPKVVDQAIVPPPMPATPPEARHLNLENSLATAFSSSVEFLNEQENLYLQGLGLSLVRYDFGPILNSTIALLWDDARDTAATTRATSLLGMTQILDSGGTFGLLGTLGGSTTGGSDDPGVDDPAYDSHGEFSLQQPLMRGFGYEVSHESLTQAERDLVYAVRDFELFREDLSIGIADDYFALVGSRRALTVQEGFYDDALFDQHKAEAMHQVDRNTDEEVILARRRAIEAENSLLGAQADYEEAVDKFKLRLGLPDEVPIVIDEEDPPFQAVALDADSAVAVAKHNRLDLQTEADRLEDDERQLQIAADALRPELNLSVIGGLTDADGNVAGALPDNNWNSAAALTLNLPLNRQAERNAYRSQQINLEQARRDYEQSLDDVDRDLRNQLRQLRTTELKIDLQREQIAQQQRAVAVMQIRYEAGDVDNRDLLDARFSLAQAQTALINLLTSHLSSRLRLMKSMGVLVIAADGSWKS